MQNQSWSDIKKILQKSVLQEILCLYINKLSENRFLIQKSNGIIKQILEIF